MDLAVKAKRRVMARISVLGTGIMATALAWPLSDNGHEVRLVGTHLDREIIDSIQNNGVHPGLGLELPEGVRAYQLEDAEEAFEDAEIAMSGVNSFGVHWAGEQLVSLLRPGMRVIAVTKGLEDAGDGGLRILPDVLAEEIPQDLREQVSWSAITGPAIAGEVAVRHDTCVVFTGTGEGALDELAATFRTDYYHVWTSTATPLGLGSWTGCLMRKARPRPSTAAITTGRRFSGRLRGRWTGGCNSSAGSRRRPASCPESGICSLPVWAGATSKPEDSWVRECRSRRCATSA
jgi:hypothetical protein